MVTTRAAHSGAASQKSPASSLVTKMLASARAAQSGRVRDGLLAGPPAALAVLSKASGILLLFVPVAAWLARHLPMRVLTGMVGFAVIALSVHSLWRLLR